MITYYRMDNVESVMFEHPIGKTFLILEATRNLETKRYTFCSWNMQGMVKTGKCLISQGVCTTQDFRKTAENLILDYIEEFVRRNLL